MSKKKPRKKSTPASQRRGLETLRRAGIRLLTAVVVAVQAASCVSPPEPGRTGPDVATRSQAPVSTSLRFAACPQFFAGGVAPAVSTEPRLRLRALCYENFAVLHDGNAKTPLFVAERLNRQLLLAAQQQKRTNNFHVESYLAANERAELTDYRNSGYARGHLAPAADMPTVSAMMQSFTMANMVPQNAKHNSGAWSKIEQDTRAYVMRATGDVYVITAPVFEDDGETIGANKVKVPTHLFKLVYDSNTQRSWVHWQQNAPDTRPGPPINYGELEYRTQREWLPGVGVR